ncbi:GntR family transcriptional regulator [Azospirillum sp. ST 5-10]|uniref:GntR family transcriptional regulator n=1 Tax=unclassified Azospirillum TaxID=2630922 RepID=UPI003F49CDBD
MSAIDLDGLDDLDPHSLTPLHRQLAERLAGAIAATAATAALRLPTEAECGRRFRVSRLTVRQAMATLAADGLVERVPGRGTFTVPRPVEHNLTAASFEEDMIESQLAVEPRLLSWRSVAVPARVRAALDLADGAPAWRLERLRLLDGAPLGIELRYLADAVGARLALQALQARPIYALVQEITGKRLHRIDFSVGCLAAGEREARLLEVPRGSPLLEREHTYYTAAGEPLVHGITVFRGDRYRFRFETGMPPARGRVAENPDEETAPLRGAV